MTFQMNIINKFQFNILSIKDISPFNKLKYLKVAFYFNLIPLKTPVMKTMLYMT